MTNDLVVENARGRFEQGTLALATGYDPGARGAAARRLNPAGAS